MKMGYNKNLLLLIMSIMVVSTPLAANAATEQISTGSIGRFAYDADKDGTPDIVLDSADVDNLSKSESANADDITDLQEKYATLSSLLNMAQSQESTMLNLGTATAADINSGATAVVKGILITGTKTLVSDTQGTAIASDILSGKTAWVNGSKLSGTGSNGSDIKVHIYVAGENGGDPQKATNLVIPYGSSGDYSNAPGHGYFLRISWSKD